ncbi:hypothetical protein [Polynucleobacter sinensis]|jgi:hypothetical protein|uniref:hypothetical protein n=1 Tax=Polynucleobacter sinensis TaxID=1743157 RepID=UPI000782FAD6|nr:hypothetical protein [Polynucleobacter sinensis]
MGIFNGFFAFFAFILRAVMILRYTPAILTALAIPIGLCACERDNYTSWSCASNSDQKHSMVLKKAQMEFLDQRFEYCGSLGIHSYFDAKCPADIQKSSKVFTPSTGSLTDDKTIFQCNVL